VPRPSTRGRDEALSAHRRLGFTGYRASSNSAAKRPVHPADPVVLGTPPPVAPIRMPPRCSGDGVPPRWRAQRRLSCSGPAAGTRHRSTPTSSGVVRRRHRDERYPRSVEHRSWSASGRVAPLGFAGCGLRTRRRLGAAPPSRPKAGACPCRGWVQAIEARVVGKPVAKDRQSHRWATVVILAALLATSSVLATQAYENSKAADASAARVVFAASSVLIDLRGPRSSAARTASCARAPIS